jgi:hypothetical protein
MREHFPIDADPGIANPQNDIAPSGLGRQPDAAAWLRILGRVVQEILQHLLQPAGISVDGYGFRRQGDLELVAALVKGRAHGFDRAGDTFRQIHGLLTQWDLAVLDAGDFHQAVNQAAHALCLPFHQTQDGHSQGGIVSVERKHLKRVTDRCQRTPQLMPQLGEKVLHLRPDLAE